MYIFHGNKMLCSKSVQRFFMVNRGCLYVYISNFSLANVYPAEKFYILESLFDCIFKFMNVIWFQ